MAARTASRRSADSGNVLAVVLLTLLTVSLLICGALLVTARGRDITSSYAGYSGVYELAVAGNEHALAIYDAALDAVTGYADENERREISCELFFDALISDGFTEASGKYSRSFTVSVTAYETEEFTGVTTVTWDGFDLQIISEVSKKLKTGASHPAVVCLDIKWADNFDGSESPVLKSKRIT
jgi:hypothetical protein